MPAILGEVLLEIGSKYLVPFLIDQVNAYVTERATEDWRLVSLEAERRGLPSPIIPNLPHPAPLGRNVVSSTPGRLRLRVEGLRGNAAREREIAPALDRLPGVWTIQASALTGNALITYDPTRVTPAQIEAAMSEPSFRLRESELQAAG